MLRGARRALHERRIDFVQFEFNAMNLEQNVLPGPGGTLAQLPPAPPSPRRLGAIALLPPHLRIVRISECRRRPRRHRLASSSSHHASRIVDIPRFRETYLRAPVAFLIFNRPDTTPRVFEAIASAETAEDSWSIADGSRSGSSGAKTRSVPTGSLDGRARRLGLRRRDRTSPRTNLGMPPTHRDRTRLGIQPGEEAMILEDDCSPAPDLLPATATTCRTATREDERVMAISGDNFLPRRRASATLLLFRVQARLGLGHLAPGMATLRRAHAALARRFAMPGRSKVSSHPSCGEILAGRLPGRVRGPHRHLGLPVGVRVLDAGRPDDPAHVNLVSNIGFRADATHTTAPKRDRRSSQSAKCSFPLIAPELRPAGRAGGRVHPTELTIVGLPLRDASPKA